MNHFPWPEIFEHAIVDVVRTTDFLGYAACALVLLTFCMQSMLPLRLVALASNFAFISYGWAAKLIPILVLHCFLAVINLASLSKMLASPRKEMNERQLVSAASPNAFTKQQ